MLGRWRWWQFKRMSRRAAGVIVTAHRMGLLPTLIECRTPDDTVRAIVTELMGCEAAADRVVPLMRRHDGNVREVLRALYEEAGELKS